MIRAQRSNGVQVAGNDIGIEIVPDEEPILGRRIVDAESVPQSAMA